IDPSSVSASDRSTWCRSQTDTCSTLCDANTSENACDANTLDFSCACVAQVSFNISDYNGSIPAFECTTWIQQCVLQSSVNGTEQQQQCLSHSCGTKDAVALPVGSDATSVGSATSTAA
ncbi:hypothetical protein BU26DRAFT_409534, partial [Trematosphaeria pertusa]